MSGADRKGFTLVELLIVVVLGGLVLAATYQTLVTNQRTFTVQAAQIEGQQTLRAGVEVLSGELRELSAPEGDLLTMSSDSIRMRTLRSFGVACDTADASAPSVTVKRVGRWFSAGDSVWAFLDRDPALQSDDVWRLTTVTAVDTSFTCATGPEPAALVTLSGLVGPDTILPGAPLRSFEQYTYGLYEWSGRPFLGRSAPGDSPEPVVGPLDGTGGDPLEFVFLDENGDVTADPLRVAQIQMTLRTRSKVYDAQGDLVRDSITIRVNARN